MPWLETDPMTERERFILEAEGGLFSFAELCRRHGISRKTGYKWLERCELEGPDGLADRSHRPHSCPHATHPQVLEAAFTLRRHRPRWGAGKILGHRLFQVFGLPERIRTDNGTPFASMALGHLSRLSIWWIKLGLLPDLIEPASPHQNGRHERMHRDLKAEATIPPAGNRAAQQRRFNAFREDFDHVRPHEAHGQKPPASAYEPSARTFPSKLTTPEYPPHFDVRKGSA